MFNRKMIDVPRRKKENILDSRDWEELLFFDHIDLNFRE